MASQSALPPSVPVLAHWRQELYRLRGAPEPAPATTADRSDAANGTLGDDGPRTPTTAGGRPRPGPSRPSPTPRHPNGDLTARPALTSPPRPGVRSAPLSKNTKAQQREAWRALAGAALAAVFVVSLMCSPAVLAKTPPRRGSSPLRKQRPRHARWTVLSLALGHRKRRMPALSSRRRLLPLGMTLAPLKRPSRPLWPYLGSLTPSTRLPGPWGYTENDPPRAGARQHSS